MTLLQALHEARSSLILQGIDDASLEAELLLRQVVSMNRAQLYAGFKERLLPYQQAQFWRLVERRLSNEPTAYILRCCSFFDLGLYIDSRAFIPRPESELLVEEALKSIHWRSSCLVADVGTGSCAIAIAIALHSRAARVYAIDISADALEVAGINCQKYGLENRICLLQGDLLQPLPESVDLIVANLPYIKDGDLGKLSPEIREFEPEIALAGGVGGLDKIDRLLAQSRERLLPQGSMLVEIGEGEGKAAVILASDYFPAARIELLPDLSGIDRVMRVTS